MKAKKDYLERLRQETSAQLALTQRLLAELDAVDLGESRLVELVLELRERLRHREWEISIEQLVATLPVPERSLDHARQDSVEHGR